MQIKCPYCTHEEAIVDKTNLVFFKNHINDRHNDVEPTPCPASEKNYEVTGRKEICHGCDQEVLMLRDVEGNLFPEGHNYSWRNGMKVPSPPDAGYYDKVWCNTQFARSTEHSVIRHQQHEELIHA